MGRDATLLGEMDMRKYYGVIGLFIFFSCARYAQAGMENGPRYQLGMNVWHADIDFDRGDGDTTMYGPRLEANISDNNWAYMEASWGEEDYKIASTDTINIEAVIAQKLGGLDLGIGYRYWNNDYAGGGSQDEHGPILYAGTHDKFGSSRIGYYAHITWGLMDIATTRGHSDGGNMEHVLGDAGLRWSVSDSFVITAGARLKSYYNAEDDYLYFGPSAGCSATF